MQLSRASNPSLPASPVLCDGAAVYTPGLSERRGGASRFVGADALGSTRVLTDGGQGATDGLTFDAFGMTVSRSGSTPTPFGFAGGAGYQADADTGLLLLGHRYYDPSVGRFLSQDPARAGDNWYDYCDNGPLTQTDPAGLTPINLAPFNPVRPVRPGDPPILPILPRPGDPTPPTTPYPPILPQPQPTLPTSSPGGPTYKPDQPAPPWPITDPGGLPPFQGPPITFYPGTPSLPPGPPNYGNPSHGGVTVTVGSIGGGLGGTIVSPGGGWGVGGYGGGRGGWGGGGGFVLHF